MHAYNNMSLKNHKQTHIQAHNTQDTECPENIRFRQNHCPLCYVLGGRYEKRQTFPPKQKLKSTSYCMLYYVMDDSQTTV